MPPTRILSLDGGGIRGLIAAVWLEALEAELTTQGKGSIRDCFDLIAGTSTGSILACGLASGRTPSELRALYREEADRIFPGRVQRLWSRINRFLDQGPSAPKYDGKGLDRALKKHFEDTRISDLAPRTMVVTYDTVRRDAIFFKSWKEEHEDHLVRDVVRASSAAPTYFPAHRLKVERFHRALIDGGVVANNPTACAVAEAMRLGAARDELVVVSVGTGEATRSISADEAQEWGALEWAIPIISVLFDGSTDAVDYIARQVVPDGRYLRLQARLKRGYDDLDNVDRTNLDALEAVAAAALGDFDLAAIVELL